MLPKKEMEVWRRNKERRGGRLAAVDLIGGTRMAKGAAGAAGDMCAGRCRRGLVPMMRVPRRPRCGEEEDGEKNDWKQCSRRLVFL